MKTALNIILFALAALAMPASAVAQVGTWRVYASYSKASKAVKAEERIFAIADGSLMSYDTEDGSVDTYSKADVLSDFGIKDIVYAAPTKMLTVLYDNANVNLLDMQGNAWSLPELKNKPLNDKKINELKAIGAEVFVCTNSGLAVIDTRKRYFSYFYNIGQNISNVAVADSVIYVKTPKGVYAGNRGKNLLDVSQWTLAATVPSGITFGQTAAEKAEQAELMEIISRVNINSPARNYSYKLNMIGDRLLVAGGNFYYPDADYPGTALKYENGQWTQFDEEEAKSLIDDRTYMNVTDVVQDPNDSEHHWIGTKRSGLYEFRDYKLVKNYSYENSPITTILPSSRHPWWYVRIAGLNFDSQGNLWMLNTECDTVVRILAADKKWHAYYYKEIAGSPTFSHTKFDKRGWVWINSRRTLNSNLAGLLVIDTNGTIGTQKDDKHVFLSSFTNQDGAAYSPINYYCMTEDLNGEMWIGTNDGLFVSYNPEELMNGSTTLTQVKVPRNDGSNLADYLLKATEVQCITIDGGNRKWIGTRDDGVYLVSPDGLETIHHFTTTNSPLISNFINDIAVNGQTGEVFFATYNGLCSYQSDAIDAVDDMADSTLKVYPNPVLPDYSGDVKITGLMQNSVVKIVNAAGRLVKEGTSVGGMYRWNLRSATGKFAAPGIYYVLATDETGNARATAKILLVR